MRKMEKLKNICLVILSTFSALSFSSFLLFCLTLSKLPIYRRDEIFTQVLDVLQAQTCIVPNVVVFESSRECIFEGGIGDSNQSENFCDSLEKSSF